MNKPMHFIGLVVAFAGVVLEPLWADALDQFALLATILIVAAGLGIIARSL